MAESGAPTTRPVLRLETAEFRHTIHIRDEATPDKRAKPKGVLGCEVWRKINGPPPRDDSEVRYLKTITRTPFIMDYDPDYHPRVVHYMLRWTSTRGKRGPWSERVSAPIGA